MPGRSGVPPGRHEWTCNSAAGASWQRLDDASRVNETRRCADPGYCMRRAEATALAPDGECRGGGRGRRRHRRWRVGAETYLSEDRLAGRHAGVRDHRCAAVVLDDQCGVDARAAHHARRGEKQRDAHPRVLRRVRGARRVRARRRLRVRGRRRSRRAARGRTAPASGGENDRADNAQGDHVRNAARPSDARPR